MSLISSLALVCLPLWAGLIIAISCIEAPLKFKAPGVTPAIGVGIGRLVFGALNAVETLLAIILLAGCCSDATDVITWVIPGGIIALLFIQISLVRPPLMRRSEQLLHAAHQGVRVEDLPRSRAHFFYVFLEMLKLILLLIGTWLVVEYLMNGTPWL